MRKIKPQGETLTNVYSCNDLYVYERSDRSMITVKIRSDHGVLVVDTRTNGMLWESNYQVFKALYPAVATFFWRKVKWNR